MSLFFLINSLAGGGAEQVALRLSDGLKPQKIFLLEKDVKYSVKTDLLQVLSDYTNKTHPILKTLFIPIYSLRLRKQIKKDSILVSFLERANYVNVFLKFLLGHKAVISVHMDQLSGHVGIRKLNHLLSKVFYPRADLCIAVSMGVKESLLKLGVPEEKIKVIYNPYPVEEIQERAKEDIESFLKVSPYLITVGRLTKQKAHWHLLRIFRELKKDFPDIKLLILGDGELKDYLTKLSEKLGLKTYVWDKSHPNEGYDVYFMGFRQNPFKYISRARLFVFPSLWEGFPNALVEAMACGVPVVSSDCRSGPREILAPDTDYTFQTKVPEFAKFGVLMPVFEVKFLNTEPLTHEEATWVETIKQLLEDERLRESYSQKAKERALDFHIEKIVQEWRRVLHEILS